MRQTPLHYFAWNWQYPKHDPVAVYFHCVAWKWISPGTIMAVIKAVFSICSKPKR